MQKHTVFVFANLKPSQVFYKILPLCQSDYVEKVIILRKEYIEINHTKIKCISIPGIFKYRPFYWLFVPLYGLYLIKSNRVSLILNYNIFPHGFNAFFASIFTGLPVVFSEINQDSIKYYQKPYLKPIIKSILSNASHITVPGSSTQKYWLQSGFSEVTKLHSTIDTNYFTSNNETKTIDFIYIGEFDENKRVDFILEAFASIRNKGNKVNFCMIGFGPKQSLLEYKIAKYGLKECITLVKTNNVLSYLLRSKIFVMASLSEGIPCALLESMACKVIPIAPDVGDISDVIQFKKNGIIYDGSFAELSKWMEYTFNHYNELGEMASNARQTIIDQYSYPVAIEKWNTLLKAIS